MDNLWTFIWQGLFPKNCLSCGKEGKWLCLKCQKKLKEIKRGLCPFCLKLTKNNQTCPTCKKKYDLDGLIAAYYFTPLIKKLIYQYKYFRAKEISILLSKLMAKKIKRRLPKGKKILTYIPLHFLAKEKRGFNQTELLAKNLSQELNMDYQDKVLIKTKNTKSQSKLSRQERIENVKDAFKVKKKIDPNATIILVDDVFTTGATINEAAKKLKKAGAEQVWGVVVAKR